MIPPGADRLRDPNAGDPVSAEQTRIQNELLRRFVKLPNSITNSSGTRMVTRRYITGVYLALPPCGESIPAMVDEVPGKLECCLFRVVDGSPQPKIEAVLGGGGSHRRVVVFNTWATAAADNRYLIVEQDDQGKWLCEEPGGGGLADVYVGTTATIPSPVSTTTTTPEPGSSTSSYPDATTTSGPGKGTTPPPSLQYGTTPLCVGRCRWIWDAYTARWNLASQDCGSAPEPGSTSTGEPTTTTGEP